VKKLVLGAAFVLALSISTGTATADYKSGNSWTITPAGARQTLTSYYSVWVRGDPHKVVAASCKGDRTGGYALILARGMYHHLICGVSLSGSNGTAGLDYGVYEAKSANAELFAFTLDKSSGGFSPTTRYRDYAISRTLIHWESQSSTRADSPTGLRYRSHERDGRSIMLFSRLRADDRAFWFLGPGAYRGHIGEKPMAITWELRQPLPGDLYAEFAAAVA
jgi:hypothetical protein